MKSNVFKGNISIFKIQMIESLGNVEYLGKMGAI
jgi:hypothetical protein